MVLDRATPDFLDFRRRVPTGAPVLVGVAFVAFAVAPLAAPGALSWSRALGALTLASAGLTLLRATRPRVERYRLELARRTLHGPEGDRSLESASAILLTGGGLEQRAARVRYRAELRLARGERALLLENDDPAALLRDLSRVLERLPLPVEPGWGLPAEATPWAGGRPGAAGGATRRFALRARSAASQRIAGATTLGGGLFTAVAMGFMMGARLERGESIGALSWALTLTTVGLVLSIAVCLLTDRLELSASGVLRAERFVLGRRVSRLELPLERVCAAWAVSPDGASPRHLLLELDDGPVAFPCAGDPAATAAKLLRG